MEPVWDEVDSWVAMNGDTGTVYSLGGKVESSTQLSFERREQ